MRLHEPVVLFVVRPAADAAGAIRDTDAVCRLRLLGGGTIAAYKTAPWGKHLTDPLCYTEEFLTRVASDHTRRDHQPAPLECGFDDGYFVVTSSCGDQLAFIRQIFLRRGETEEWIPLDGMTYDESEYATLLVIDFNRDNCGIWLRPKPKEKK